MNAKEPQRVPGPQQRKRRRSAFSRVILSLLILGLLVAVAGGVLGFIGYQEYNLSGPLAGNKVVEIDKGLSTPEIASRLADQGVISDARIFSAAAYLTGERSRLKAGEYEFPAGASMRDVINLLASGKSVTYKISIPEGWTSDMVVARVNENEILTGEIVSPPPEGSVLPDTYVFGRGKTRQGLIDEMREAQQRLLDEIWPKHNASTPLRTREEAVILASIVEKETGEASERPVIASVFLNRLAKGMRLQSDPTIIYGIAGGKGKLDRPLSKADIEAPTPFNTYTIDGLPPGPIANPGRAALEAVANPPDSGYLYFVADGTGGHAFAATLEEHNRNVARWRNIEGNAAAAEAAAADAEAAKPAETASEAAPPAAAEPAPATEPPPETAALPSPDSNTEQPAAPAPESTGGDQSQSTVEQPAPVETASTVLNLKPGSVIRSGDSLIPVPKRKPKR